MNRVEFVKIMGFITAGCGKQLGDESLDVYYQMLGDLPYEVMQTTACRVLSERVWATFPQIGELRQAAAETMRGQVKELQPAEAWEMAWSAASNIDLDMQGPYVSGGKVWNSQAECVLDGMPPLVLQAMKSFGLPALVYGKEPVGVIRGQFIKIFEQLQAVDRRHALLPQAVKDSIYKIGQEQQHLPEGAKGIIDKIGVEQTDLEGNPVY